MRKFKTVFMRGGTSKGCMFLRDDLPENQAEWDEIFLQVMGCPDPKQIDGMGGTVSSNNKIVIVWKSEEEGIDVEYLVGQVIVGKEQVDLRFVEQLIHSEQTAALAQMMRWCVEKQLFSRYTVSQIVDLLTKEIQKGGLTAIGDTSYGAMGLCMPRVQEIFACLNRYRG